ncbi:MAG: single-stranded DNA-binding protein [Syntrophothermus sp.]
MASSLNKIMLIGNLGKDGETRFTATGSSVTSFSLATTYSFKNKDGNWVNETTWHNVMAWNASDYIKEKLKKGKKIYAEGRLSKRDYVDKDGIKRYMTEVVAEKIIPLDSAGQGEGGEFESTREMLPEQNLDQDLSVADSDLPF